MQVKNICKGATPIKAVAETPTRARKAKKYSVR
jgi:hypothetical protein